MLIKPIKHRHLHWIKSFKWEDEFIFPTQRSNHQTLLWCYANGEALMKMDLKWGKNYIQTQRNVEHNSCHYWKMKLTQTPANVLWVNISFQCSGAAPGVSLQDILPSTNHPSDSLMTQNLTNEWWMHLFPRSVIYYKTQAQFVLISE